MDILKLGKRIEKIQRSMGVDQITLANRMGVSTTTASNWTTGKKKPGTEKLILLAELGNVSLDWLITGQESQAGMKLTVADQGKPGRNGGASDPETKEQQNRPIFPEFPEEIADKTPSELNEKEVIKFEKLLGPVMERIISSQTKKQKPTSEENVLTVLKAFKITNWLRDEEKQYNLAEAVEQIRRIPIFQTWLKKQPGKDHQNRQLDKAVNETQ